jgi:hypothetical protein
MRTTFAWTHFSAQRQDKHLIVIKKDGLNAVLMLKRGYWSLALGFKSQPLPELL